MGWEFLRLAVVALLFSAIGPRRAAGASPQDGATLFPVDLPRGDWIEFRADGFLHPVCGVIYRRQDPLTNGMALGGIDTGCLDFASSGLLGYATIFNSQVPRRGPILLPLIALSAGGKTWALCRPRYSSDHRPSAERVPAWLPEDLGLDQPAWMSIELEASAAGWFKSRGRSRYDLPAGRVACHTPAVLCWTSPIDGDIRIRGGLWLARNLDRPQRWELAKNSFVLASGMLEWGPTSAHPSSFARGADGEAGLSMRVEEGDLLEIVLQKAGVFGDFVGVDLTIAATGTNRVWDLAKDWSDESNPKAPWRYDFRRGFRLPIVSEALQKAGIGTAREIHYWGHYPVLDIEFETDAPIRVGMRAWSPFLPGDVVDSMIPGIVFEMRLRNPGGSPQTGAIALTFPGPSSEEALTDRFERREIDGPFCGVSVKGEKASYALGAIGDEKPRIGGELGTDLTAWTSLDRALPAAGEKASGACAAVDFSLPPSGVKTVRFVLAWAAPTWSGGGHNAAGTFNVYTHMYAKHYPEAPRTAEILARRHESLLRRILSWQEAIYSDEKLPPWLRDSLINVLYTIAEDGCWAQKRPPIPEWVKEEDGLFGLNECPRECPQIECIPCSFYGSQPLVYFFPELELSTIRGYKGYQYDDGAAPWIFGGCTGGSPPMDFASPSKGYQWASNGVSLAGIVDRFLLCRDTPDRKYAKEFYPMLKRNLIYTIKLRTTAEYSVGERIISMPDRNESSEWFEKSEPGWYGMTAHIGGLHLAQLRIVERIARDVGDTEFARQCADWIKAGADAMEKRLWNGSYYLNYWEPETGKKSDMVFGYQLDGEWITDHHGLPSALPESRVRTALATIQRCNVKLSKYGAVNYAHPDGAATQVKGYGPYSFFPPEALMLAMNYMYEGQRELGLELARKVWHNLNCARGYTWDTPNTMRGDADTGERVFGSDYYQNMMLWSLPAAIEGKDFGAPARPGGLADRVLRAASRSSRE